MPLTLEVETFMPLVGATFLVRFPDGDLELTLSVVEPHGARAPQPEVPGFRVRPFSLVFLGPLRAVLPQRTWELEHPALGSVGVFLVPIGPAEGRMRYEAVFN